MKSIKLFGKEYPFRMTARVYTGFEKISGLSMINFDATKETLTTNIMLLYATLKANYPEFMEWSAFMTALDELDNVITDIAINVAEIVAEHSRLVEESASKIVQSVEKELADESKKK